MASRRQSPLKAPTIPPAATPDHPPAEAAPSVGPGGERMVVLAAVVGAHGIRGEVRLKLFGEDLSRYRALHAGDRTLTMLSARDGPNGTVARFAEIADRDSAEGLRGTTLSVPRSALPPLAEGEYYHADLIGLPCETDGQPIGMAVAVENFGAGDILEIELSDGKRVMVPVATAVTIESDRLIVDAAFVV